MTTATVSANGTTTRRRETIRRISLNSIVFDEKAQCRVEMNQDVVDDYADLYKLDPCPLPPIKGIRIDDNQYVVYDGYHRIAGAKKANLVDIPCVVMDGLREDAEWLALGENKSHGLRRTQADKEKATRMALKAHPELSDLELSRHVGVSDKTVAKFRTIMVEAGEIKKGKKVSKSGATVGEKPPRESEPPESSPHGVRNSERGDDDPVAAPPPPVPPARKEKPKDANGRCLPKELVDVFGDPDLPDLIRRLTEYTETMRFPEVSRLGKKTAALPFLDLPKLMEVLKEAHALMGAAIGIAVNGEPHIVCPDCHGKGCDACRQAGYLPRGMDPARTKEGKKHGKK